MAAGGEGMALSPSGTRRHRDIVAVMASSPSCPSSAVGKPDEASMEILPTWRAAPEYQSSASRSGPPWQLASSSPLFSSLGPSPPSARERKLSFFPFPAAGHRHRHPLPLASLCSAARFPCVLLIPLGPLGLPSFRLLIPHSPAPPPSSRLLLRPLPFQPCSSLSIGSPRPN